MYVYTYTSTNSCSTKPQNPRPAEAISPAQTGLRKSLQEEKKTLMAQVCFVRV